MFAGFRERCGWLTFLTPHRLWCRAGLLHDVRQLMRQQLVPRARPRRVFPGRKCDILPDGKRLSVD